jgi:hypothetical protein
MKGKKENHKSVRLAPFLSDSHGERGQMTIAAPNLRFNFLRDFSPLSKKVLKKMKV